MRKMPKNRAFGENIWGEGLEKGEVLSLFGEKFTLKGEICGKFMQIFVKFSEFWGKFKRKFSSWREFHKKFSEFKRKFQAKFSGETPKKVLCHYRTWKQYER